MLLVTIAGWLGSGAWMQKWHMVSQSALMRAVGVVMLLVMGGMFYGERGEIFSYGYKYAFFLLIPIIYSLQLSEHEKKSAVMAFCAAMLLTLLCSMLLFFKGIPPAWFSHDVNIVNNPSVFKSHITHNFFMALAVFMIFTFAQHAPSAKRTYLLSAICVLMAVNVLFMVKGRTGQITLIVLLAYLVYLQLPRRGLLAAMFCIPLFFLMTYAVAPSFRAGVDLAVHQAMSWHMRPADLSSSVGTRLDFYRTTVGIIFEHPWLGVGTEGFPAAYARQIAGTALQASDNPHNQYLLLGAQYGLVGLGAWLFFYLTCWREARDFKVPWSKGAKGLLLAYAVGNLFNSFMLDFSERLFFVWAVGLLWSVSSVHQRFLR